MCSRLLIAVSVVTLAIAARADTPDLDQGTQGVADETAATATRVHLTPHLDLGFGLPTGVLGAGLEARYGRVALDLGGGMGLGGPQAMAHLWGYLIAPDNKDSAVAFALGAGYSVGDVQSRGDLGGVFGPDNRYRPAHWLNLTVGLGARAFADGTGPVVRFLIGAMLNLDPDRDDHARILAMFGLGFGWDFRL